MKIAFLVPGPGKSAHEQAVHASFFRLIQKLAPDHALSLFIVDDDSSVWTRKERHYWERCGIQATFLCSGNGSPYGEWSPCKTVWSQSMATTREAACAYAHLRSGSYDAVIFSDFKGLAHTCLQAKRLGAAFSNTRFHCWMLGSHEWLRFDRQTFRSRISLNQIVYHDSYEQYCVRHTDTLWASDSSLPDWHRQAGWKLPLSVCNGDPDPSLKQDPVPVPPPAEPAQARVSLLVPHHNAGETLGETLRSLASQTYANLEIWVLDDGSTNPDCVEIFRSEARRYREDPRFHFIEEPNRDVGGARNYLAARADGDYFIFVDPDNICRPDMTEKLLAAAIHSGCDVVTCYRYVFKNSREITDGKFHALALHSGGDPALGLFANSLGDVNCCIRRRAFEKVGGFDEARGIMHHDWDIMSRLVLSGADLECYPEPLFYYRLNPKGMSHTRNRFPAKQRILDRYCSGLPPWTRTLLRASFPFLYYPNQLFGIADKTISRPGHLSIPENEIKRSWTWKVLCPLYKAERIIRAFFQR